MIQGIDLHLNSSEMLPSKRQRTDENIDKGECIYSRREFFKFELKSVASEV